LLRDAEFRRGGGRWTLCLLLPFQLGDTIGQVIQTLRDVLKLLGHGHREWGGNR